MTRRDIGRASCGCVAMLRLRRRDARGMRASSVPTSDVPASYDFGPPPPYTRSNPAIPGTLLIAPVRAPPRLDDTGIVYRLLYEDSRAPCDLRDEPLGRRACCAHDRAAAQPLCGRR